MGCLIYMGITLFIGAAICVSLDLEGDSAGGMFVMFLCILGPIIAAIIKNLADEAKKRATEKKRLEQEKVEAEKRRITEGKRLEQEKVEAEKRRITEMARKVHSIIHQYTPLNTVAFQKPQPYNIEPQYVNKDVVFIVNQFKEGLKDTISKCNEVDTAINRILCCESCNSIDEKFAFLSSKIEELQGLKSESDLLHDKISKNRISLMNEDGDILFLVKESFSALISSKKCVIDNFNIKDFICKEKPAELECFNFKYPPAIIRIGQFYYCFFSNVILIFDSLGVFTSAIDPSALKIQIERVNVWIKNNTLPSHPFIDVDSKCVNQGTPRRTWVHTCRDGSPDLRYSYNPTIEYRTDKYEYGKVTVSIVENSVTMRISSEVATKALERVSKEYIKKYNNRHNPIPEFLKLLTDLSEDGEQSIVFISEAYKSNALAKNYFCNLG